MRNQWGDPQRETKPDANPLRLLLIIGGVLVVVFIGYPIMAAILNAIGF